MLRTGILLIFLLVSLTTLHAQQNLNYVFSHLNKTNGFPAKRVGKMVKGPDGLMWMLTDQGLMRYNGHTGKFYAPTKDSSGLLPFPTLSLYFDTKGLFWISYLEACISSFDPKTETFTHYFHSDKDQNSFPNGGANNFYEDKKGQLWIAVWGGGLSRFDRTTGTFFNHPPDKNKPGVSNTDQITNLTELNDGQFLVTCWESGPYGAQSFLQYFDPNTDKFRNFPLDEYNVLSEDEKFSLKSAFKICHFAFQKGDNIWVGSYIGIICIDTKAKTIRRYTGFHKKKELDFGLGYFENARQYVIDNSGKIWIGTEVTGIMIIDPETKKCSYLYHDFSNSGSIGSDNIVAMFSDEDGNVWISTSGGGVDIYSPLMQQFKFTNNRDLHAEKANRAQGQTSILQAALSRRSDNIYLSHGDGFTIYNPLSDSAKQVIINKQVLELTKGKLDPKYHNPNIVSAVLEQGSHLLLNNNGLLLDYSLAGGKIKRAGPWDYYFSCPVRSRYNGEIRLFSLKFANVGKEKVQRPLILQLDTTTFSITDSMALPEWSEKATKEYYYNRYIAALDKDNWIMDYNRYVFYVFNSAKRTLKGYSHLKSFDNFPDSVLTLLTTDPWGNTWIKGAMGLYKFDYRTGIALKYNDSLGIGNGKDMVASITFDKKGIMWAALYEDLIRYDMRTGEKYRFGKSLGLNVGSFSQLSTGINTRDDIYIPSSYGLLRFDPEQLHFSKKTPDIFMSQIVINKDTLSEKEKLEFASGNRELPWDHNFINFEFASVQIYTPGQKSYRYRLLGLDTSWSRPQDRNFADFQNLSAGGYTLQVYCRNIYGIEGPVYSLPFSIGLPLWKRWWFIAAEILIGLVLIRIYTRYREEKLTRDKEKLEAIVEERTAEVREKAKEIRLQNELISEKNKELTDSIRYAERIQKAVLSHTEMMGTYLPDYFIFFKPKDIVSGDFYWASVSSAFGAQGPEKQNTSAKTEHRTENFYLAVCDSTGHGVPGAFMSLLNISYLNEAISEKKIFEPDRVLNYVREKLMSGVAHDGVKDGMDGILVSFEFAVRNTEKHAEGISSSLRSSDAELRTLTYAAANNAPVLVRDGIMTELPKDKMPIGQGEKNDPFTKQQLSVRQGDMFYLYTDGYADQFGGPKGKKFKHKNLNALLLEVSGLPLPDQHRKLNEVFEEWKSNLEQVDDVCVIGIRF
ncbi:MAG: SpoIIE family protein phosphatase [Bacteroidia bacterium]